MTYGDPNEYRLVRDLMKSYDKRIRPSFNHSDPLNVTFGFSLAQIIDVASTIGGFAILLLLVLLLLSLMIEFLCLFV